MTDFFVNKIFFGEKSKNKKKVENKIIITAEHKNKNVSCTTLTCEIVFSADKRYFFTVFI